MPTVPMFNAQLLGQTEKAANAILDRLLAEPRLSEPQWVTLSIAAASGGKTSAPAMPPSVRPVCLMPIATPRRRGGNQSSTALPVAGLSTLNPKPATTRHARIPPSPSASEAIATRRRGRRWRSHVMATAEVIASSNGDGAVNAGRPEHRNRRVRRAAYPSKNEPAHVGFVPSFS